MSEFGNKQGYLWLFMIIDPRISSENDAANVNKYFKQTLLFVFFKEKGPMLLAKNHLSSEEFVMNKKPVRK